MRKLLVTLLAAALLPSAARAQAPGVPAAMPLVVDMTKTEIGAWAEYKMAMGSILLTSRWALVARDATSNTLEVATTGSALAKAVVLRMVLPEDPTSNAKLRKPLVLQLGHDDPMIAPPETLAQRFQRPDDTNLVGKEEIKVAAGTFKTRHYREKNTMGTVDIWVSEDVAPLGVVKVVTVVDDGASKELSVPPATMELVGTGTGERPIITKKPKPYDAKKMQGLVGGGIQ
jgi:hypothetical protein